MVRVLLLRLEFRINGLADDFRHGRCEPLGALPEPAMPRRRQLYLNTAA